MHSNILPLTYFSHLQPLWVVLDDFYIYLHMNLHPTSVGSYWLWNSRIYHRYSCQSYWWALLSHPLQLICI